MRFGRKVPHRKLMAADMLDILYLALALGAFALLGALVVGLRRL
jgi:hypothetical protein